MPSIEIPQADFRVAFNFDFDTNWENPEVDVTFVLMFGGYEIVEKTYTIPKYDYDDVHFNDSRDKFDKYVAERLSRLFT